MQGGRLDIEIRPARDNEARACRMLLPEIFLPDQAPDLLVAIGLDHPTPHFAGALAVSALNGPRDPGFSVWLHVVPPFRRQGIGRALVAAVVAQSADRTPLLRALQPVEINSDAALFLTACGFGEFDEIHHFEADCAPLHAEMKRLLDRLAARRLIPFGARVVKLCDAPAEQVAAMMATEFPASRAQILAQLTDDGAGMYDMEHSTALMVGDQLGGVLLAGWREGVASVEAWMVARQFRGGWANILLIENITRIGVELNTTRFRFSADTRISDTMSLARRAKADLIRVERRFRRSLSSDVMRLS